MLPYPILELGDVKIYTYGLMIAIGSLCCFLVLFEYSKRMNIPGKYVDFCFYNGIVSIVIGFLGSAVWQGLFNYIDDIKNGREAVFSLDGGITAIGGLVSGALCFIVLSLVFKKRYPFNITKIVKVAPCCMAVAHGFGRLGCLFAGCCHGEYLGSEYVFGGVKMLGTLNGVDTWGYYVPTQLYEALVLFAIFAVITYLGLKKNFHYGFVIYMVSYGIWRFFIEFFRADYRGSFVGSLSPSQTQSLIIIALAIPAFFILRYFKKKMDAAEGGSKNQQPTEAESADSAEA